MADILTNKADINAKIANNLGLPAILDGSIIGQLSESVAQIKTDQDTKINQLSISNSILSATGLDLDSIGNNIFGITRTQAQLSKATVIYKSVKFYVTVGTFGDINQNASGVPQDIIIPQGVIITGAANGINYTFRVSSDVTLNRSDSSTFVPVEVVSGDYNIVPSGTLSKSNFQNYSLYSSKLLLVTNSSPIVTGNDIESDDNYRFRIFTSQQSKNTLNPYYIQNQIQDLPAVSYCIVEPAKFSGGTFTVYVQGTSPITSQETINSANAVMAGIIPPWSSDWIVTTPNYIGLELGFNVTSNTTDTGTISQIQSAIATYINNFSGTSFTASNIFSIIYSSIPNVTNIDFAYIHVYTGDASSYRTYTDYTSSGDVTLSILNTDKLIIEPIPNAVEIYFITG